MTCADGTFHITLTWTESAGAQSYSVIRSTGVDNPVIYGPFPATQLSFSEILETANRPTYSYTVRAMNAAGAWTAEGTQNFYPDPQFCPPPGDAPVVSATGACENASTVAHVRWTPIANAVSYTVLRNAFPIKTDLPASTLAYDEVRTTGYNTNFVEYYSVRAILPGRTVTSASVQVYASCVLPPAILSGSVTSCDSVTNQAVVHLSWTLEPHAPPILLLQRIRRDDVNIASFDAVGGGTYDDRTAVPGQTYKYVHRWVDGPLGYDSAPVFITTCPLVVPPSAPSLTAASSCNGSAAFAHLTWTASSGVTSYAILRNGAQIGTATSTTFDDLSVQANQSYGYFVRAVGPGGTADSAGVPLLVVPCVLPHADLMVTGVTVSSETPAEGELVTVTYSLSNVGTRDAAATTTRIRLGAGPDSKTDDLVLTSFAAPPLATGITVPQIATVSIPKGFAGGTFYLFVSADDAHVTDDINVTNNVGRSAALQVVAPPACVLFCAANGPGSAIAGKPVSFVAAAACIDRTNSVTWDLGDNTIISGSNVVSHTYEQPGTYHWTVHISSGPESCDKDGMIRIDAAPPPPKHRSVRH
jgi:PKD repeat protein